MNSFHTEFVLSNVLYRGKKRYDTVSIFLSSDDVEERRIEVNNVVLNNLRVQLGDLVSVHQCMNITYSIQIHALR